MSVTDLYNPTNQFNLNADIYVNSITSGDVDISGNITVDQIQVNQAASIGTTFPNTVLITNGNVSSNTLNVGGLFTQIDQSGNIFADGLVTAVQGFESLNYIVGFQTHPSQVINIGVSPLPAASINLNIPDTGTPNANFVLADNSGNLTPNILTGNIINTNTINSTVINGNRQYAAVETTNTSSMNPGQQIIFTWQNAINPNIQGMLYSNGNPGSGCAGFVVQQKGVYNVCANIALDLSPDLLGTSSLVFHIRINSTIYPIISFNAVATPNGVGQGQYKTGSRIFDLSVNDTIQLLGIYTQGTGAASYSFTASNNTSFMANLMNAHI